jgi:hypothetical protein
MFEIRKKKVSQESSSSQSQIPNKNIPRTAQKDDEYAGSGCNIDFLRASAANSYKCNG